MSVSLKTPASLKKTETNSEKPLLKPKDTTLSSDANPNNNPNNNPDKNPDKNSDKNSDKNLASFQLKGRLFTLSVLQMQSLDLEKIDKELEDKIKLAPKFFENAPVVIDISDTQKNTQTNTQTNINFTELKKTITKHGLIPVGVKGTNASNNKLAQEAGFAIMTDNSNNKYSANASINNTPSNTNHTQNKPSNNSDNHIQEQEHKPYSKLITQPIRSGQQVYSPGDLIIVSSVSPGAELLAEGSIHVYGTLRGRALAGINGSKSARIFCNHLEAELVSIAGQYKIFEDIQEHNDQTPKQLYLDDTQLIISSL
jgi:septum site-determining protein MinC